MAMIAFVHIVLCVFCGVFVLLFGCLVCLCFLFCWHGGSPAPNVDIVRFRCWRGVATLPTKSFSCFLGDFVLFWSTLIPFTLAISLYMSVRAR